MAIKYIPICSNTRARYKQIQERYDHLYNIERKRRDDCKAIIEKEYFLERRTLNRILLTDLNIQPEQTPKDPNQMGLFGM